MAKEVYYRPPSEAESFIVRVMTGCPHNKCSFCNMFKDIPCKVLPVSEIIRGMQEDAAELGPNKLLVRSMYLEGGDPLFLDTEHLLAIMQAAKDIFPALDRFACYATARFAVKKTQPELDALARSGLTRVFVGLETGVDELLTRTHKGCTTADLLHTGLKLAKAGIEMDVSMMLGIGGAEYSASHASQTARLINALMPVCVRIRTFMPKEGTPLGRDYQEGKFRLLGPHDTIQELRQLVELIDCPTRLLSEHWTNFVLFDAWMPQARETLLKHIEAHLQMPETSFRKTGLDTARS